MAILIRADETLNEKLGAVWFKCLCFTQRSAFHLHSQYKVSWSGRSLSLGVGTGNVWHTRETAEGSHLLANAISKKKVLN